jgi:hypothetical protein
MHDYDKALRDLRVPHYQNLFHLTEAFPRYWEDGQTPTRLALRAARESFHRWYFGPAAGGMFLSHAAREAYFAMQNDIQTTAAALTRDDERVSEPASSTLRSRASVLRHQLSADLGVAEQARQRWTLPQTIAPPTQ